MNRLLKPLSAIAASVVAIVFLWPARTKAQFNPQPDPPAFGLVGVSPFETLQLNTYCAVTDVPPGPCAVRLQFADLTGHVLTSTGATLQPGQSASLTLRGSDATRGSARTHVLPAVQVSGPGGVVSTLEFTEDGAGRTNFILHPTPLFHGASAQ